jgi:hypothetical protein
MHGTRALTMQKQIRILGKYPMKVLVLQQHQSPVAAQLKDKLQNAFHTKAGLSAEAIDHIWEDAQGNE